MKFGFSITPSWDAVVTSLRNICHPGYAMLTDADIEVQGDNEVGWSARYPGDPNWVWSGNSRESAVRGCRDRRQEVLDGTLVRGPTGFYSK